MEPDADLAAIGRLIGDPNRAERHGRQQLYSVAGQQVAGALETLLIIAPPAPASSLRGAARMRSLRWARMCYDHLAGGLGAALAAELTRRDWARRLDGSRIVTVTPDGSAGLSDWLGLDLGRLKSDAAA